MIGFDWITVLVYGLVGLVLLMALWPTPSNGRRLLEKWKVIDPSREQVAEGVRYLKRRRLLYPWLYIAAGLVTSRFQGSIDDIVITVLVGTLLAELLALRPPRDRRREATLVPRGLFQIASPWVLAAHAASVITALVLAVLWNRGAVVLVTIAAAAVVVALVTWAAVVRPASGDPAVDGALRTRSVHVSAGVATALVLGLAGGMAGFAGLFLWVAMAHTPPRVREDV